MQKNKKISNKDLQNIFYLAHANYVNSSQKDMNHQEFVARCYLEACAKTLDATDIEFEEKIPYSPADE